MPHKKAGTIQLDPKLRRFSEFRQEHTEFVTLAYGHAGKAKILLYDLAALVKSGALHSAVNTPGTIFTMDSSLIRSQSMYVAFFLAIFTVSYFAVPDVGGSIDRLELEEVAEYLNVFIPFILGLYISLCLARWWMLRVDGVGAVLDASLNLSLLMSSMFPGAEWSELHDQVLRWGLASVSLIVNSCREIESIESLGPKGDGLVTEEEMLIIKEIPYRARPQVMWCWILMLSAKICGDVGMPPGRYRDIAMECVSARNGISLIWTYLRTQLPFAYVHLVTFLVNLNNLVVSFKCGMVMAMAMKAGSWSQCVNQVLFLFVVPPLYQGLLGISHVIHDPFGEDLLDFPVMAFQEYTNESCVSVIRHGHKCPALEKAWGPSEKGGERKQLDKQGESIRFLPKNTETTRSDINAKPAVRRENVQQVNQRMVEQITGKENIIRTLREQVKGLELNVLGMTSKIQGLENRPRI